MTRLTKEEIEKLRVWADGAPRPGLAALVVRALDELEEHRAREGKGVTLSEDAVEKIRAALEMACEIPAPTYRGRPLTGSPSTDIDPANATPRESEAK